MRSVFIILLLVGVQNLHAERLPIKIYTSADGLGTSATFNLVRDSRGFIWICSRDGLIRFDGYRFITYRIGNDDADPAVYNLLPTRSGIYWVNLNRGTDYRFIDKGESTSLVPIQQQLSKNDSRVPLANVEPITDLRFPSFEDSQGNLWGYEPRGLDLLREVDGRTVPQLVELNLPGNPGDGLKAATFESGSEGSFWIGTNWGLVRRLTSGSIEFQQTGYLRYLLQKESFGSMPQYSEYMRDLQELGRDVIVNSPGWEQKLKDNQQQFTDKWANRPAFKATYDGMSNVDYVNALYANAGILPVQAERQSLVNALDTASETRSAVLLDVAANASFMQKGKAGRLC